MAVKGFFGRILTIDVTEKKFQIEEIEKSIYEKYLGGKGLATHLLLERNLANVDPLSPENRLILGLGPLSDSPIYGSCRHGIYSKSPLTGFYAESYSGGSAAIQISRTGFDAVIITGASENPIWLEISDNNVVFHDASELWGLDTFETERRIKDKLSGIKNKPAVISIGPAGERLVRFAVVENDKWRSAGRTGMGAVLGSKKVKAIACYGEMRRNFYDADGLSDFAKKTVKELNTHKATEAYRQYGTPMMVALLNNANAFPTRYWSKGQFERWQSISAEVMKERYGAKPRACKTCFMACGKYMEITEGEYKGLTIEGPEYETIYAFGGLCEIDRLDTIAYFNDICDRLGIDTITAGNLVALAIEASKRGKISDKLDYGNPSMVADVLKKIAYREGIGDVLADGIVRASKEWGLEEIAVHVKGLEPAGYDPRVLKGMALAYAVSDRGACHLRTTFYKAELAGMIPPDQIEGKVDLFIDFEDRCTLFDCGIICRFYRDFYLWDELAAIYGMATGLDFSKESLKALASRVTNSTRRFNLREGLTVQDDMLPDRLFDEPLENGAVITREEFLKLRSDYYKARGWSDDGIPPRED